MEGLPRRGDEVEAWIKRCRDECPSDGLAVSWGILNSLLDEYREHADFGVPLDQDVPGPHPEED